MGREIPARHDPLKKFKWQVTSNGIPRGGFVTVTGLADRTSDIVEYREGIDDGTPHKSAGLLKWGNITLVRGMMPYSDDQMLWNMAERVSAHGNVGQGLDPAYKETVTVDLFDNDGVTVVRQWVIYEAWVCRYAIGTLDANASEWLDVTIELCHEGIQQLQPNIAASNAT